MKFCYIIGQGITKKSLIKNLYKYNLEVVDNIIHADTLIVTPGYATQWPFIFEEIRYAYAKGMKVINDIDLFQILYNYKNLIGITGTNGKTTVCYLLSHILTYNKIDHALGGNIGIPV